jgi:hypothetical protein
MIFGRKTLFSTITILSILGYGIFVFAVAPTGGYEPGETLNPTDCFPDDTDCKVKMFLATTLSSPVDVVYEQSEDFLGLGIPGAGQVWDTGTGGYNIIGSIDATSFGGTPDTTIVGYLSLGPGAGAISNYDYDAGADESTIQIDARNNAGKQATIQLNTNPSNASLGFHFNGGASYNFPNTSPGAGQVLGYVSANTLGWVTAGGGSLAIGDTIGSAAVDQILFIDGNTELAQSSYFTYDSSTGVFQVKKSGNGGSLLSINQTTDSYGIGDLDISNNGTYLKINDNTGNVFLGTDSFGNPGASFLSIDSQNNVIDIVMPNGYTRIGAPGVGNGNFAQIDDGGNEFRTQTNQFRGINNDGTKIGFIIDYVNSLYALGDTNGAANSTQLYIDDTTSLIDARTFGGFRVSNTAGTQSWLEISTGVYGKMGDVSGIGNNTLLTVNDNDQEIRGNALNTIQFGDVIGVGNHSLVSVADSSLSAAMQAPNGNVFIGDPLTGFGNGTHIQVDDINQKVKFNFGGDSYSFPTGDGSMNQVLTTDGAGQISWGSAGITGSVGDQAIAYGTSSGTLAYTGAFTFRQSDSRFRVSDGLGDMIYVNNSGAGILAGLGDVDLNHLGTRLRIDDANETITINANKVFEIDGGVGAMFRTDRVNNQYTLGDINIGNNGTTLTVDDTAQKITFGFGGPDYYSFPTGDGSTDYVLATNGAGQIYWADAAVLASDASLKSNIQPLNYGLDTLMQLNPVSYILNSTGDQQIGFIAQEVESLVPELVGEVTNGKKGLRYGQLTSVIVKSVQEMNLNIIDIENFATAENKTFLNNLITWLADAANGIGDIFASRINTHELCVDGQCLNQEDVRQLIQIKNQMYQGINDGFGYGYGGN